MTIITQTLHVEVDVDYRSLYNRPATADHWFDTALYPTNPTPVVRTYNLALDDFDPSSSSAIVRTVVFGGQNQAANPDQSMVVRLNSHTVGAFQWEEHRKSDHLDRAGGLAGRCAQSDQPGGGPRPTARPYLLLDFTGLGRADVPGVRRR
ncbi:MAG: hypothetical protein HZY76_19685 [Anaerolineae bacterium]|nr:MAG: hypothetical protein HZY76_19685 [Anaerolineae bacterium]